ncbi:hypothetical protein N0V88_007283 [Collariella sp. IMI 366227]|nr:hypothetical protein N0V88_007283 [Collariella sp. IMI 366227]
MLQSPASIIGNLATKVPHNVWVKIPYTDKQGAVSWQDITWLQLRKAVDYTARWLENGFGLGNGDEPIAYSGVNDVWYPIMIMAALKTGYKATECRKFLFGSEFRGHVEGLAAEMHDLNTSEVPALDKLLTLSDGIPYETHFKQQLQDHETILILHSSGTTGLPKPVYVKSGVFRAAAKATMMPGPQGRRSVYDDIHETPLLLSALPLFHSFGILLIIRSIYYQGPLVLLPPDKPPTGQAVLDAFTKAKPTAIACAPSILEDICGISDGLETLSIADFIIYGGAPLAQACGDRISRATRLINSIGSTEAFTFPNLIPNNAANWEYYEWNPHAGIVMDPTPDSHLAEFVIHRQPDNDFQTVFHNFPDLTEWRSNDLYEKHPTKPGLWKYVGRADDIIVLSNGEKINPVSFEKMIEGHAWVRGALVVGAGQFQAGLIIEPHANWVGGNSAAFVEEIWSWVEEANAKAPAHGQVWRSMIRLVAPEKPFKRSPKGSVMRQATYRLCEGEIKGLYATKSALVDDRDGEVDSSKLEENVRMAVCFVFGPRGDQVADHTNFFSLGMDSLQVLQLRQTLDTFGIQCSAKMVYESPSIILLCRAISSERTSGKCACNNISREEKMSAMINRYSQFDNCLPPNSAKRTSMGHYVLLVGSTGSLGTYLLHRLLRNAKLNLIYCLNRSENAAERQAQSFFDRDLRSFDANSQTRVRFLTGETHKQYFGLQANEYAELQQTVDTLILNAWPVNFNAALDSFESVIAGTKRCVEFAASSSAQAHVIFISSISTVMNSPAVRHPQDEVLVVPEEFDPDNSLPAKQGYAESKHVASCVLARAVKEGLIGATILRVGQLAGAVEGKGLWNQQEWLPSLVKSSKSMGKIPQSLGPMNDAVNWVPVDLAAKAILELGILKFWLKELKIIAATTDPGKIDGYPALKLLDFFESMGGGDGKGGLRFATEKGNGRSNTVGSIGGVKGQMMRKWLDEWEF